MRKPAWMLVIALFALANLVLARQDDDAVFSAQDGSNIYTATCEDGSTVVGLRLTFLDLNPVTTYRITLIGIDDFDPAMAAVDAEGAAVCSDNDGNIAGSRIGTPSTGAIAATSFSTQRGFVPRPDGTLVIIAGGKQGPGGQFALLVEGTIIEPRDETDSLRVDVPPALEGEWLGVYMFGQSEALDPTMQLIISNIEQPPISCNNAGTPDCPGSMPLTENGALLSDDTRYIGDASDAGIVHDVREETLLYTFASANGASQGAYALIITGIAPGDPVDPRRICNNVVAGVSRSSPAYNAIYAPENAIDDNTATVWATGTGEVDAATGALVTPVFYVVRLNGSQRIDRIRLNGFVPELARINNSLKGFEVVIQNSDDIPVTAFRGEARLQPGYQEFRLLPTIVDEVAFLLKSNYGGAVFEIADVQVCAV